MTIIRRAARRKASTPHGATPLYGVPLLLPEGMLDGATARWHAAWRYLSRQ